MKGFKRENQLLSLCGLNCGLCPMFLGKYCGGCGKGNQSCAIAKCSLEHGKVEYCYECEQYPCEKYLNIEDFDSFITHKRQKAEIVVGAGQSEVIQLILKAAKGPFSTQCQE